MQQGPCCPSIGSARHRQVGRRESTQAGSESTCVPRRRGAASHARLDHRVTRRNCRRQRSFAFRVATASGRDIFQPPGKDRMADTRARFLHSRPLPFARNAACYTPMRSPSPWQRPAEPPLRETQGRRQQRPTDSTVTVVTERYFNDKSNFLKSGICAKR